MNSIIITTLFTSNILMISLVFKFFYKTKKLEQEVEKRRGYQLDVENNLNGIIADQDEEIEKLKKFKTTLDKWDEHYQNQIVELEANLMEKSDEHEKSLKRIEVLEKECYFRKIEILKLRTELKTLKNQPYLLYKK